jgi:flagellar biosynthesis protein FliQ
VRPLGSLGKGMVYLIAVDYQSGLNSAWEHVATFIPKFIAFLLILVIGYFVAKFVAKLVDRVLERVGFDGWVERGGFRRALEKSK